MNEIKLKVEKHFQDAPIESYPKSKILVMAGQEPKGVGLLIDGLVEQYHITPEGNRVTLNIFKPSAFFPMSWAINKTPNIYFYAALSDIKIKFTDAHSTVEFLRQNPDVTFDLLSRVYTGTDGLLKRLAVAASGLASSRLIYSLLIEAYRFGTRISESEISITVKQNDLAARSGLARETVSREIHKLTEDDLITITKNGLVLKIADLEGRLDISL